MRYARQKKILELIAVHEVETQENLLALLKSNDFDVTQATVSRDIRELQLVKVLASSGKYKYALPNSYNGSISDRFIKIFKETILSVKSSGNIVLVKTLSGCGPAAGEAIDSLNRDFTIGSVAGDNTVMLITDDPSNTQKVVDRFQELLN